MELDSAIEKLVKISELEIKDLKIRRIFVFADGKRTLKKIFSLSGFDDEQGIACAQQLFDVGAIGYTGGGAAPVGDAPTASVSSSANAEYVFSEQEIEVLVAVMGEYVGPVASMLVNKTVKSGQGVSMQELDGILSGFANSIEDNEKREEFLATVRSDFGL